MPACSQRKLWIWPAWINPAEQTMTRSREHAEVPAWHSRQPSLWNVSNSCADAGYVSDLYTLRELQLPAMLPGEPDFFTPWGGGMGRTGRALRGKDFLAILSATTMIFRSRWVLIYKGRRSWWVWLMLFSHPSQLLVFQPRKLWSQE